MYIFRKRVRERGSNKREIIIENVSIVHTGKLLDMYLDII